MLRVASGSRDLLPQSVAAGPRTFHASSGAHKCMIGCSENRLNAGSRVARAARPRPRLTMAPSALLGRRASWRRCSGPRLAAATHSLNRWRQVSELFMRRRARPGHGAAIFAAGSKDCARPHDRWCPGFLRSQESSLGSSARSPAAASHRRLRNLGNLRRASGRPSSFSHR